MAFVIGDGNFVLFAGALVHSRYIKNTVGINIKSNFNLRNTSWSRWDSSQLKFTKKIVVPGHGTLSFINLDKYTRLVIRVGCEGLGLILWNGGVPLDKSSHHTSSSFNTQRQWSYIQQKKVLYLLIRAVITPPAVSIPKDNGATSNKRRSCTSSGLMLLLSSFPLKKS